MANQVGKELEQFHRFLAERLASGEDAISPEEALDQWRNLHPAPGLPEDDAAAVQEALDDLANGDEGVPAEEVLAALRAKFGHLSRA